MKKVIYSMEARCNFGEGQDCKWQVFVGCHDEANDRLRKMAEKFIPQGFLVSASCRIIDENGRPSIDGCWEESTSVIFSVVMEYVSKKRLEQKTKNPDEVIGAYYREGLESKKFLKELTNAE